MPRFNPVIDDAPFIPLVRSRILPLKPEQRAATVRAILKQQPYLSRQEAHDMADKAMAQEDAAECWASVQYTVLAYRETRVGDGWPPMDWLSIRRDDREPVRDWRHMQAIKDQLCGPDREGVELYPSDARLVDTANQFHIWVLREAGAMFPFGFSERSVTDDLDPDMGARQRARAGR